VGAVASETTSCTHPMLSISRHSLLKNRFPSHHCVIQSEHSKTCGCEPAEK
jgi:hypothetical protein